MRYNLYENGLATEGVLVTTGMEVTNFISLRSDPLERLEAASKGYVDYIASTVRSDSIISGFFNSGVMPALSGHVLTSNNSTETTLSLTGVTPGTYTKITVNTAGRIVSGGYLTPNDIPALGWLKFNGGKPSTLAGYEITDGVLRNNGEVVGNVRLLDDPVVNTDVASKGYVDNKPINLRVYQVGDLIETTNPDTPTGFLRCNGGDVLKSLYSDLYTVIGDQYAPPVGDDEEGLGLVNFGKPWSMQSSLNTVLTGGLSGYNESDVLPFTLNDGHVIITKNRLYLFPFEINDTVTSNYYTNTINNDSSLNTWSIAGTLPLSIKGSSCVVVKGKLYLIGREFEGIPQDTLIVASINQDGTLGTFSTKQLPTGIKNSETFYINGKIIVLAGSTVDGNLRTVLTGVPTVSGDDVTWEPIQTLDSNNDTTAMFAISNKLYKVVNRYTPSPSIDIEEASVDSEGVVSSFTLKTTLIGSNNSKPVVVNKGVYFFNVLDPNSNVYNGVFLPFNGTDFGTPVIFNNGGSERRNAIPFILKDKLYLLGGVESVLGNSTTLNKVSRYDSVGGYNDYTVFYNEGVVVDSGQSLSSSLFRLPDFTPLNTTRKQVYVKY